MKVQEDVKSVLIVDDEEMVRLTYAGYLKELGFKTLEAGNGDKGLQMISKHKPDVVLLDLLMPGKSGIETLRDIKKDSADLPVIMLTAFGDIPSAVEAMKAGAYEFMTKPPDFDKLGILVRNAVDHISAKKKVKLLTSILSDSIKVHLGDSRAMSKICNDIITVAETGMSVIIEGETGTGKGYIAKLIHSLSKRAGKPLVKVDLSLIPEALVESELFGYEKGAFTGADKSKKGFFETANYGTILLDELQTVPRHLQNKLLSAVEDRKITPLGSQQSREIDIRIIALANRSLEELVKQDSFGADLYYRLNEYLIKIPALRDHKEDIAFFAGRFLTELTNELQKVIYGFTDDAIALLGFHDWPGNLRELKNVIRRAILICKSDIIDHGDLAFLRAYVKGYRPAPTGRKSEKIYKSLREITNKAIESVEKDAICHVLNITGGNKKKAASLLQVDYKTLFNKIRDYRMTFPEEPLTLRPPRLDVRSRRPF
ncbi:MAG: sigma-54 dependent transcriptional regulator [Nitrospirae bacterium YQR-1]